ncbi:MAG: phenylalanine--tRNA ligase subunit alpha [Gammaproteobacteria bacterium]|nr:phenylalanine--tRNA ligase subunit alpha [Gammaproteobacteria bacterium]
MDSLQSLLDEAKHALEQADTQEALETVRVTYLGKKGKLTDILKGLVSLPVQERAKIGQQVNQVKQSLIALIEEKRQSLLDAVLEQKMAEDQTDVTLPGQNPDFGSIHPVSLMQRKMVDFFMRLGFDVVQGPEVETDFYNFEALNIPSHHPARAMHDTFYFGDGRLLRTHTSPVQIRAMQGQTPPFRLIAPGKVYRYESDLTHTPMFHQIEGLYIDKHVTFTHLRGILQDFLSFIFEKETAIRFRPSYFPFTEPSAEVDMQCTRCEGRGCRVCKETGWLEMGGCGMVHPAVLKAVGVDGAVYQGWAFGMGIDRLAMLYSGIDDLRALFENDIEFLKQFGGLNT